ncbi:alpha/beta hydrolase family protein [Olivibacter jilunii]|uniref:alpha/beta hydrolase family protein n=1 Tax=Olivibacter jilunii TaxID=985016 RepID=UPI00102F3881|nr:prolyl oligopeptidase family serine peptidase [Olivibacter jilunii]
MKNFLLLLLFIAVQNVVIGQRNGTYKVNHNNNLSIGIPLISNDGNYSAFHIDEPGSSKQGFIFKETFGDWIKRIPKYADQSQPAISGDSKKGVILLPGDSLCIIELGSEKIEIVPEVESFQLSPYKNNPWLLLESKFPNKQLIIRNLKTKKSKVFTKFTRYYVDENWQGILLTIEAPERARQKEILVYITLPELRESRIWEGKLLAPPIFGPQKQVAFLTDGGKARKRTLCYYKSTDEKALPILDTLYNPTNNRLLIDNLQAFSDNGNYLYFTMKESKVEGKQKGNLANFNIWSFTDSKLQPQQLIDIEKHHNNKSYLYLIDVNTKKTRLLASDNEICLEKRQKIALIGSDLNNIGHGEGHWNNSVKKTIKITHLEQPKEKEFSFWGHLSPAGKFYIYYNDSLKTYFSYEVLTGISRNITESINSDWIGYYRYDRFGSNRGIAGWLKDDSKVLLYDRYDIWLVDPMKKSAPINVTNEFGLKNHIVFDILQSGTTLDQIRENEELILVAYNLLNKNNGFYKIKIGKKSQPEMLTMGPYIFCTADNPYIPENTSFQPIKAKESKTFIVKRTNSRHPSVYLCTKDFKTFKPIIDVDYSSYRSLYTSELHTWRNKSGTLYQGILYKPSNFDSTKQYPVIVNYYERKSDGLNAFLTPGNSTGEINIPSFVNDGYLVFTPDIFYNIGSPGESALNAVESGTLYLNNFNFVNKKKIGIQGFSFGGYETNYIVTHSNLFAAACATAGVSDLISFYNSLREGGSLQGVCENGQLRIGQTIWQNPELYINNSPIFNVDDVTTPILLVHGNRDIAVPFAQSVEFFNALRRLGKIAWLIEYEGSNHGIHGKQSLDYTTRMKQFFDHYLKDMPPPLWMTQGISAEAKGIEDGLKIDQRIGATKIKAISNIK